MSAIEVPIAQKHGLRVDEAAAISGLSADYLWKAISDGRLPVVRPTQRTTLIRRPTLDAFVESLETTGRDAPLDR